MDADEARILLGFPPNSRPTPSQVKSAYKRKVWESHPDLFRSHEKPLAESKFKLVGEKPQVQGSWRKKKYTMIRVPFMLIILGTFALGGFNASRAYKKQKEEYPSHNPFLP